MMTPCNYHSLMESRKKWNSSLLNVLDLESESKRSGKSKGGDFGDSKLKEAQVSRIFYLLV